MRINWHFRRQSLAEQFLDAFDRGSTSSYTLFAPRRMGKTEFARQDLIPMAQDRGYVTVYVNFWDRLDSPDSCLLLGLKDASSQLSVGKRLSNWLQTINKLGIKTPYGGIDIGTQTAESDDLNLDLITEGLDETLKLGKPVLLVLDEVQHLATRTEFESLVFALRGIFDHHRQQLKVVYTGSSRNGLNTLFKRKNAALFSSSQQIDLPELGTPFLEHLGHAFLQATNRQLRLAECQAAYRQLKKIPYDYQQVIDILMRHGGTDIESVTQRYIEEQGFSDEHAEIWQALKPVDQAVLRCIAEDDINGLYTQSSMNFIASQLGLDRIERPTVQNALNRLKHKNIVASTGHGQYDLEDPHFKDWVLQMAGSE